MGDEEKKSPHAGIPQAIFVVSFFFRKKYDFSLMNYLIEEYFIRSCSYVNNFSFIKQTNHSCVIVYLQGLSSINFTSHFLVTRVIFSCSRKMLIVLWLYLKMLETPKRCLEDWMSNIININSWNSIYQLKRSGNQFFLEIRVFLNYEISFDFLNFQFEKSDARFRKVIRHDSSTEKA